MTILVFVASLLAAMALGMPLAFSLLVSGVALMLHLDQFDTQIVSQNLISGADNFPLMAVPFFMLAGELMNAGGMSRRIVNSAMVWVGHFRGGLGYVAVFAALVMASLSGSAVADTAALAAVLLPMMRKAGYRMDRSAGLIASGGIIAPVIPPSIGFILFGVIGGVSISKLFMAGIVPGLMMGAALIVTWWLVAHNDKVEVASKVPMRERVRVTADAFWSYLLAFTIIGGMKAGIFTPTEAAAMSAVYAFFVAVFVYKDLGLKDVPRVLLNSANLSAMLLYIITNAILFSFLMTHENIPQTIADWMLAQGLGAIAFLLFVNLLLLVAGTLMEPSSIVLILAPILFPVAVKLGIDPVHFGIIMVVNMEIGMVTPPVGLNLYVASGITKMGLTELTVAVWPWLLTMLVFLIVITYWPPLSLFLPRALGMM